MMVFGFVSCFLTVVFLGYRNQLRTRFPVIPVCLICCSIFGFWNADILLGLCLLAVAASECRRDFSKPQTPVALSEKLAECSAPEEETRINRMFGRA